MSRGSSTLSTPLVVSSTLNATVGSAAASSSSQTVSGLGAALHLDTDVLTMRARSNSSSTSSGPQLSPTDVHHQSSRSMSYTSLSSRVDHGTPPPRPPRGAARSPRGAARSPFSANVQSPSAPLEPSSTIRLIQRALDNSNDEGETLDLSRERLEQIGDEEVEMFRRGVGKDRKGVWRLALSYNALRDGCIVPSFSALNRLRYLNLKGNHLTVVPPALTEMQALEILDLSKNAITSFPDSPGSLVQLKVLSLSYNAISTLPTYLVTFSCLKVFKVDHNPVEWPPKEILGPLVDTDLARREGSQSGEKSKKDEDLRPWIDNMKNWLRERTLDSERSLEAGASRTDDEAYLASEEEPFSATSTGPPAGMFPWSTPKSSQSTLKKLSSIPGDLSNPSIPKIQPSLLGQRNRAATFSEESLRRVNSSSLSLLSQPSRHDRSVSSSSLTPPVSASTVSSSASRPPSDGPPSGGSVGFILPPPPASATGHSRGSSYTATQRLSANLTAKKSLPDLRMSHAKIIEDRVEEGADETRPLGLSMAANIAWLHDLPLPRAPALVSPLGSPGRSNARGGRPEDSRTLPRVGSADLLRRSKATVGADVMGKRGVQGSLPLDESRNSYFRRLSMLPASTISKAISPALLKFVDAIRGLLFALSQLHAALRQYLNFAVSDRIVGVFTRVLEPAGAYLSSLINALDRFDSMSRRSEPPVNAIRAVIDSAKESVVVFAKVVAVLRLQTPALKDADLRYTRQLLLNIYGTMAEVACAWKEMAPLLVEIRPLLHVDVGRLGAPLMSTSSSLAGRAPISPILERGESHSPEHLRSGATTITAASPMQPVHSSPRGKSRRQAGSFSTQDVERGMLMGSPGSSNASAWPDMSRTIREDTERPELGPPIPLFPLRSEPEPPRNHFPMVSSYSQPARSRHAPMSSAGSSHALSVQGSAVPRNLSVDVRPPTPASATLFDEDLLDVIETATEIAFTVWLRLAEDIGSSTPPYEHSKSDSLSSLGSARHVGPVPSTPLDSHRPRTIPARQHLELVHMLSTAEQVTTTLRESLMGLRANPFSFAHTTLPDDAQAFIKTVVRVSELIKAISTVHTFAMAVRQCLSQLTQATRECAILIQVSSLRPTASTPALVPPSATGHYPRSSGASTAMSSMEDLVAPVSAGWGLGGAPPAPPPKDGLRGLQLPTRQLALRARSNVGTTSPPSMDPSRFGREIDGYPVPPVAGRSGRRPTFG